MKTITCACGSPILLDDDDYERLRTFWWSCGRRNGSVASQIYKGVNVTPENVQISHCILEVPIGLEVDHADRNIHNNQKGNLRIATRSQQLYNTGLRKDNTSGYKGVSYTGSSRNPWQMHFHYQGKRFTRSYTTAEDAAKAYDRLAIQYAKEFARTNFPLENYSL